MSDFIYSRKPVRSGKLTKTLQSIYREDKPTTTEFTGAWGTLAVSANLYEGFQPLETPDHLCVVIGGPLLYFRDNEIPVNDGKTTGTEAIYERWRQRKMKWDEDLSGFFAVLIIDKTTHEVTCITDLMSFIPVYCYDVQEDLMLSTHIDVLARGADQLHKKDPVSQVDFILHGVVTYPYTTYKNLRQIAPATIHTWTTGDLQHETTPYWLPKEEFVFSTVKEAAAKLREGLKHYVDTATANSSRIAHFISGGEDSRVIAALLPRRCERDAIVLLDSMNREGRIARKAAKAYGANFILATRSRTHYLDILPDASDLIGSDSEFAHVHTYKFHKSCEFTLYEALFGGLLADALLKGSHIRKEKRKNFPWRRRVRDRSHTIKPVHHQLFTREVLKEVSARRLGHFAYVQEIRKESAVEWFDLWPSSMNFNIANIHGNRRLFRSYEPFTATEVVKMSAMIPQDWKLNRLLFHKTTKPFLRPTKWLVQTKGRLPYFPWYINRTVVLAVNYFRKIKDFRSGNQGPWSQWKVLQQTQEWKELMEEFSEGKEGLEQVLREKDLEKIFDQLTKVEKRHLMQVLYHHYKHLSEERVTST